MRDDITGKLLEPVLARGPLNDTVPFARAPLR